MDDEIVIDCDCAPVDWSRLAEIFAKAPFVERRPDDLQRAFENSYRAVFAYKAGALVGAARATSDGVYYATVFDVVVAREHQGAGIGRQLMAALLAELPFEKVFLTSVFGKEGFYRKFGFLKQNNAMGRYAPGERAQAVARGVLSEPPAR